MVTRTFDILEQYKSKYVLDDALAYKKAGEWHKYSGSEYISLANDFSMGLMDLGLKSGDKLALISNNRPEWNIVDMGCAQIGVICVPIYPTISSDDYKYILNHAEPKLIVVSDKLLYEKIKPIAETVSSVEHIYTINQIDGANNLMEILNAGKDKANELQTELESIKKSILPESLCTIIYTSGTTGAPKGVMLSHANLVHNVISTAERNYIGYKSRAISFLPLSHVYERMMNYHFQYKGTSIYYSENLGTIMDDIKYVKPNIFNTVPRLMERIYSGIIDNVKEMPVIKQKLFSWATKVGMRYERHIDQGWYYYLKLKIARKLVFNKWLEILGGNIQIIVSGGAALQPRLSKLFGAAGIDFLEGYGLTETSPVIAVNNPGIGDIRAGSVGTALPGNEIKIADDGEILCRGKNIMMGYYKAPELTAQVIDADGWFHTGDIGTLVEGKYLTITDRKKEVFKLSSGKYISPQVIENKAKESFFIDQIMVIGENEKFASALISPNFGQLHKWCRSKGLKYNNNNDIIIMPEAIKLFQTEINKINSTLGQTEHIKRFKLIAQEWSPSSGELSPSLKLKRKVISERYKDIISEIYQIAKPEL